MKALDLVDGMDSEPTWHLDLPRLKLAARGANLIRLNQDVQQLLVTLLFLGGLTADHGLATKQNGLFGRRVWMEASTGKRSVCEGCGQNIKRKGIGLVASRGCPALS